MTKLIPYQIQLEEMFLNGKLSKLNKMCGSILNDIYKCNIGEIDLYCFKECKYTYRMPKIETYYFNLEAKNKNEENEKFNQKILKSLPFGYITTYKNINRKKNCINILFVYE